MQRLTLIAIAFTIATPGLRAQGGRQSISLNGEWEVLRVPTLDAPREGTWQSIAVPGTIDGVDGGCAWFRTHFEAPESVRGQHVELYFGGVKYNSRVFVNSKEVGGCFNGYDPFTVDVTDAVRIGQKNELLVGCRDWQGIFTEPVDVSAAAAGSVELRSVPEDVILGPIGGLYNAFGPWDDVELRSHPHVSIERVEITTSVRQGIIRVHYVLLNETDEDVDVTIATSALAGDEEALRLPGARATVPARASWGADTECPWPDVRLWSHEDPFLYHLRSTMSGDGVQLDSVTTRFGFREFWCQGQDFYLNGSKIHMLASSAWPMHHLPDREAVRGFWQQLKAGNSIAFRTHTQPWRRMFYDVADEVGVLVIPEGAVWNDDTAYRVNDPAFWRNYENHLHLMSAQYRNNPSVVMYSLENEFFGGRVNETNTFATERLAELGRRMKWFDPTRPVYYESDGDPLGVADAIGLHYPHEYPEFGQYPDTGWWLAEGTRWSDMYGRDADGVWRWKRDKPLYIGEFLWVPSSTPAWDAILCGDQAYTDYQRYHLLGKARAWKMQIEAYRDQEVSGICPWTEVEGGPLDETNPLYIAQREAFRPIAAFVREYNGSFYGGREVPRTFVVYNDTLSKADLMLTWTLEGEGIPAQSGERGLSLLPGDKQDVRIIMRVPQVKERTPLTLTVSLQRGMRTVFEERHDYAAYPEAAIALPKGLPAVVFDPANGVDGLGEARRIASLHDLPEAPAVVVIGPGAFPASVNALPTIGPRTEEWAELGTFVRAGGRVIVLEQTDLPLSLGGPLTTHASTIAFAQMPDHPILRGISDRDLKWWAPSQGTTGHQVSVREPSRPARGSFRAIVTSAGAAGLAYAPLVELPRGDGTIILCQLLVTGKAASEPTAARLMQNMLDYAAAFEPEQRSVALLDGDDAVATALSRAGVRYTDAREPGADGGADLLIASGAVRDAAALRAAVESGKTVLLHSPTPEGFAAVAGDAANPWRIGEAGGPVMKIDQASVGQHILNEDLYWLGPHAGLSWATTPLASDIITAGLTPGIRPEDATVYSWRDMAMTGQIAQALGDRDGYGFFTTGRAEVEVDFGQGGTFLIGARLGGTPAAGGWPQALVAVDGEPAGVLSTTKGEFDDYATISEVAPGTHRVSITFTNDASGPGEDRNLFIQSLLVARYDESGSSLRVLIRPGALAELPLGKGRIVVDCVRWDAAGANGTRAQRYLCGLLTALGAEFEAREESVVEAEMLSVDPDVRFGGRTDEGLNFGSAGGATGEIEVTEPGDYDLELVGRGTPAAGVYPIVRILLDDQPLGEVEVRSDSDAPHSIGRVSLTVGRHALRLEFTNDFYAPPEDRNVWIDKLIARRTDAL